jgi:excisionase family DNA binding protein
MPKRPNPRMIKAARCYTISEAADALGVTVATVRSWIRSGLPAMTSRRPYLILGDALRNWLQSRCAAARTTLRSDQLYCLTCKVGQKPGGMMVDCVLQTSTTARLMGLCETCGGTCNRMVSRSDLARFAAIFDVALRGAGWA